MKKVIVLGSTGSLGTQTLRLLKKHKKHFVLIGISANTSEKLLKKQAQDFHIPQSALASKKEKLNINDADIVINLISGTAGIKASKESLKKGKTLLLANKESVVAAGLCHPHIIPLDSEHNAIYEILQKKPKGKIKKIWLPCSGGPFYQHESLKNITPEQAVKHPRWKMGAKISVESATLINKGLEIVEAHYLFNLPLSKIKSFYHPECQIHGVVEFKDETLAYYGKPKMEEHIENALLRAIGQKPKTTIRKFNASKLKAPANPRLKGIKIVLDHFKKSPSTMDKFLKKEELIINQFLQGKIEFTEIFTLLR